MMSGKMPGAGTAPPPPDYGEMTNLSDKIDKSQCYALNESAQFPMTNLFMGDSRLGCKSDADEQLIIHVAFHEFVKVSGLMIYMVFTSLVLYFKNTVA